MADHLISLSPDKPGINAPSVYTDDDYDISFHDVPSSPFVSHLEYDEPKENVAPETAPTPVKPLLEMDDDVPQSAFKVSPEKKFGSKDRASPTKMSPVKNLMEDFEEAALQSSTASRRSPKKTSPVKQPSLDRPGSALSSHSRHSRSPSKTSRAPSAEPPQHSHSRHDEEGSSSSQTPTRQSFGHDEPALRDNEGLTVAMKNMEDARPRSRDHTQKKHLQDDFLDMDTGLENTDFNPDGPELTAGDIDDTCFSTFSEMPGLDMTKFAFLKKSPSKDDAVDVCFML